MARRARNKVFPALLMAAVTAAVHPGPARAGVFLFAGDQYGMDVITHPGGYMGTGGVLDIEVCIDADAANATAMEVPIQNIIGQINNLSASSPNLFFDEDNAIPDDAFDFESLTLHELGHCLGLGHPNVGYRDPEVTGADTDQTNTSKGANNRYDLNAGADDEHGTSDDVRGDDQNLHWFVAGVNNPFLDVTPPVSGVYTRDLPDLPANHDFVVNAHRYISALFGYPDTEAVMQQGQGTDEEQRQLQADDVATFRMGMTGLDETAGTADDYTINLVYGGIKQDTSLCDIKVKSRDIGSASCSLAYSWVAPNHYRIRSATFYYNPVYNWHFNTVLADDLGCSAGATHLTITNVTHNTTVSHEACASVSYGPSYLVGASGNVTVTAPSIRLGAGTTIRGRFSANVGVP